jgi:hypothetical protein
MTADADQSPTGTVQGEKPGWAPVPGPRDTLPAVDRMIALREGYLPWRRNHPETKEQS